ncbi:MAG: nucleotidyltransferase [Bacteroidetes bacterium]|nr:MAG: nucleotidyltransferase [Bacteroidota bacterium]
MKPTLLILAAGLGSRYGGIKQMDRLGPSGETLMEYSVFDAIRAGFGKVVFVIRRDIEQDFREAFMDKISRFVEVDYVLQELDNLPPGITVPEGRTKPWGTGHAVMVAEPAITTPFAMINADDFYGREAYQNLGDYLSALSPDELSYSLMGYKLANTLSEHGSVSRAVVEFDSEGKLISLTERTKIYRKDDGQIIYEEGEQQTPLADNTIVSMNMLGFTPTVFGLCKKYFEDFISEKAGDLKAELYIPTVMSKSITEGASVQILNSDASWFGMTYREDKDLVISRLRAQVDAGYYPENLWA